MVAVPFALGTNLTHLHLHVYKQCQLSKLWEHSAWANIPAADRVQGTVPRALRDPADWVQGTILQALCDPAEHVQGTGLSVMCPVWFASNPMK